MPNYTIAKVIWGYLKIVKVEFCDEPVIVTFLSLRMEPKYLFRAK